MDAKNELGNPLSRYMLRKYFPLKLSVNHDLCIQIAFKLGICMHFILLIFEILNTLYINIRLTVNVTAPLTVFSRKSL